MKFSRFILRGIIGGLIGGPLFLIGDAIHDKLRMGHVPYGGAFQAMAVPYLLILGTILGASIGCIIWAIVVKARIILSFVRSAMIGGGFIFVLIMLLHIFGSDENDGLIPPTQMEQFVTGVMFVVFLGVLPGMLAHSKHKRSEDGEV